MREGTTEIVVLCVFNWGTQIQEKREMTRGSSRQFQYLVMWENGISVDFAREVAVQCSGMVDS